MIKTSTWYRNGRPTNIRRAGGKQERLRRGLGNGKTIDQAWFAGFYPARSPKYVIVALVENGTSGVPTQPLFKYIADYLAPSCVIPGSAVD